MLDFIKQKHHYGRYRIVKDFISGDGKNLLDIGCGSPSDCMEDGAFLRYLGYGNGIDIRDMDIEFPFAKGNIMGIPFEDGRFDIITAIEVLEHVPDIRKALSEVRRVLKKGGIFVMSTPNNHLFFRVFWWFWEKTFGTMWHDKHITNISKKDWINLLKGYFEIEQIINYWRVNLIVKMRKSNIIPPTKVGGFYP